MHPGIPRLSWLLAIALGLVSPVYAEPPDAPPFWIENPELCVVRTPAPGAPAAESPEPNGEVFDSADYQSILLLADSWHSALILDLVSGEVSAHAKDPLLDGEGQPRQAPNGDGEVLTSFLTDDNGKITFEDLEHRYSVEPVPPMVGVIPREELYRRQPVYARRAHGYTPDPKMVAELDKVGEPIEIVAFFGSWCQICKHHLPALLATIDHTKNPNLTFTLVGLDENLEEPADWIANCGVIFTPSFVVRRRGEEIGRIEEEPKTTIEADLVSILQAAR